MSEWIRRNRKPALYQWIYFPVRNVNKLALDLLQRFSFFKCKHTFLILFFYFNIPETNFMHSHQEIDMKHEIWLIKIISVFVSGWWLKLNFLLSMNKCSTKRKTMTKYLNWFIFNAILRHAMSQIFFRRSFSFSLCLSLVVTVQIKLLAIVDVDNDFVGMLRQV